MYVCIKVLQKENFYQSRLARLRLKVVSSSYTIA